MNIITVYKGKITNIFSDTEQNFIVIEGGICGTDMRDIQSKPLIEADKEKEIELSNTVIAQNEGNLYITSAFNGYYIGRDGGQLDDGKEVGMGDGVDQFSMDEGTVSPGTLLFQAMCHEFLKSPEIREAYGLEEPEEEDEDDDEFDEDEEPEYDLRTGWRKTS